MQSQNSSAKLSLFVDDIAKRMLEIKQENTWNQLKYPFYVDHNAIGYRQTAYYAKILKDTVDRLIESGVMQFLIKTYIAHFKMYPKMPIEPNILNIYDLMFGFNIFLGFCGISGLAFVAELFLGLKIIRKNLNFDILKRKFHNRKVKNAKVHPMNTIVSLICTKNHKLSSDLIEKFKKEQKLPESVEFFKVVVEKVCDLIDDDEKFELFGENVKNLLDV